jgi:RNA polymerase sigma-70 factor (ECF subfamily)
MKLHLTNFLANKDITVMEGALENPPEDPFHCPPAISMVGFHRDGKQIQRMRIYFTAPTPRRLLDVEEEEALASKEEVNSVR